MNLSDLLALMSAEYATSLDEAKLPLVTIVEYGRNQINQPVLIDDSRALIERSVSAFSLVQLAGATRFLMHVDEVICAIDVTGSMLAVEEAQWAINAFEVVGAYLETQASADAAELIQLLATQSPLSPAPEWLDALALELAMPPAFVASEEDDIHSNFDPPTLESIGLNTADADPELLSAMLVDAPRQLERLHGDLTRFAASQQPVPGALAEAQRIAHTLKGSGNIIGIPGIANVAHRLEDVLVWLDADIYRDPVAQQVAVRDALTACDVLQQAVGYLNGEDAAPSRTLPVLERMVHWAQHIAEKTADEFHPEPLANTAPVEAQSTEAAPATVVGDGTTLRVGADQVASLVTRLGQSLAATQRVARTVRDAEERLLAAQDQQLILRSRLDELQRVVDRQVVVLQEKREAGGAFDALEMDRFDALHVLSRSIAEAVQDQVELTEEAKVRARDAMLLLRDDERSLREQHKDLLSTRLVQFNTLLPRLRRNVAQTAADIGKQAQLVVFGENVSVDAEILSRLTEPLLHLIRNAIDHGLEAPELREVAGKSIVGTVELSCERQGSNVVLTCRDDGRGIDTLAVHERAVRDGLVAHDAPFDPEQAFSLILQRGFSTKNEVSQVSGRGIGMDIVAERIRAMKGTLSIASTLHQGTEFRIVVPVSTGLAQALVVEVAEHIVAVPSDAIVSVLPSGSAFEVEENAQVGTWVEFLGERLPLHSLSRWLGYADNDTPINFAATPVIIARGARANVALAVDRVIDVREFVLQDVGSLLRRVAGLGVGSIGDAGTPVFLIDVPSLERRAQSKLGLSAALALRRRADASRARVLVVDDSLSARRALEQAFEDRGFEVMAAGDGFEALEVLRQQRISLVATDLEMPNLNGLELAKRMREVPDWATIPIMMVTSRGGDRHRQAAIESGVNEYLVKPFANQHLLNVADALLAQRQDRAA